MTILSATDLVEALGQNQILPPDQLNKISHLKPNFPLAQDLARELVKRGWLTGFQAEMLLEGRGADLVLNSYLLLEPRGEGGMGKVYKAIHRLMKRPVALKIIRPDLLPHPRVVERFKREIQAFAKLNHPNIVVAHDAHQAGEAHFLVMEYLEGIDLDRLVKRRGPLPIAEACEYVRQAALGLAHVHAHGMVHRDIKPSNLLLTRVTEEEGKLPRVVIKILDMGLILSLERAEFPHNDDELTETRTPLGTPAYAAPEQVIDPHAVDIRADIFSLGCTLYYLLTSQAAYPRRDETATWKRHEQYTPPPVIQLRPEMPEDLAALVHRMMAKEPQNRCQTPGEVIAALTPHCQSHIYVDWPLENQISPATDQTPTAPYLPQARDTDPSSENAAAATITALMESKSVETRETAKDPGKSHLAFWVWVVAVLMLLLLFWMGRTWFFPPEEKPSQKPFNSTGKKEIKDKNKPIPVLEKYPVKELCCFKGHSDWVASAKFSPDGAKVISGGAGELLQWDAKTGDKCPFLGEEIKGIKTLAICPKGEFLLTGGQEKDQYFGSWNLATRKRQNAQPRHTQTICAVAFSGDGLQALSLGYDQTIWLWDVKSGKEVRDFLIPGELPLTITFVPEKKQFLTASWKSAGADRILLITRLWETEGDKEPRQFAWTVPLVSCAVFAPDGENLLLGYASGGIELFDWKTNTIVKQLTGHTSPILALAFSPDGKRALSGSGMLQNFKPVDCTLRLWEIGTGEELYCFSGHTAPIWGVAFSPGGHRAVSASQDKTVRVWGLP